MKVETTVEKHIAGSCLVKHLVRVGQRTVSRESIIEASFLHSNFDRVMEHHVAELKQAMKRAQEVNERTA